MKTRKLFNKCFWEFPLEAKFISFCCEINRFNEMFRSILIPMRKLLLLLRAPAFLGLITVDINFSCSIEFDFRLISFGLIIELSEKKELLEFV